MLSFFKMTKYVSNCISISCIASYYTYTKHTDVTDRTSKQMYFESKGFFFISIYVFSGLEHNCKEM